MKKYFCEAIGTAVLVLFGCGTAVITANTVAIALAFGLSIVAMAYVIGDISGCHVNPAVSLAMLINKKITVKEFAFYVLAQVVGAFVGAGLLYLILHFSSAVAQAGGIEAIGLGTNGFGEATSGSGAASSSPLPSSRSGIHSKYTSSDASSTHT